MGREAAMTRRLYVLGAIVLVSPAMRRALACRPSFEPGSRLVSSGARDLHVLTGVVGPSYRPEAAARSPAWASTSRSSTNRGRRGSSATLPADTACPTRRRAARSEITAEMPGYKQPCRVAVMLTDAD